MSERTPLQASDADYYTHGDPEESEVILSKKAKISLGGVGGIVTLGIFYLLIFFLPRKFVPEATDLTAIQTISHLNATFNILDEKRAIELDLGSKSVHTQPPDDIEEGNETEYYDIDLGVHKSKAIDRLILIGDIHGHYDEFKKLLKKVKYNHKTDHLLLLGDFISKGPRSLEVLEFAIENNIDCILGNHEYYVLQNYAAFHGLKDPYFGSDKVDGYTSLDKFNDDPEFLLAKKLQPEHVHFINSCSVIKKLGSVPLYKKNGNNRSSAPGVAVHAGIRWDLALEDQNPIENLEMRSLIGPHYNVSTDDPKEKNAVSWSKIYNQKQKEKAANVDAVVYYGHDARRGLKLKKFTKGLDSRCDGGGRLSALVMWRQGISVMGKRRVTYNEKVVQVKCK